MNFVWPQTERPSPVDGALSSQARSLAAISCAAAPDYAILIAETLSTRVLGDFAEVRSAAAIIAGVYVKSLRILSAGIPTREAALTRLAGQRETRQRYCGKAEAESFEGLPARYRLRHTFRQLVEFVVHNFILSLFLWFFCRRDSGYNFICCRARMQQRYASLKAGAFHNAAWIRSSITNGNAVATSVAAIMSFGASIRITGRSRLKTFADAPAPSARIKTETRQRYGGKAEAESCEGLPARYGLRHTFRQLIEFVVHSFILSLSLSGFFRARILGYNSSAAAPGYSRYAGLLADAVITGIVGIANEKAAAALGAARTCVLSIAHLSGCTALSSSERFKTETGQRYGDKAEAEPFEGLPPRDALRHAFRQLIEFVVHNFSFALVPSIGGWFAHRTHGAPDLQARILAIISPAAGYSRYANSIAETGLSDVLGVDAEVRFAAAFTALIVGLAGSALAKRSGRQAGLNRLGGQRDTGQHHSYQAEAEPFEGLASRYGLRHTFRQLIEFVAHNFTFLLGFGGENMMHEPRESSRKRLGLFPFICTGRSRFTVL